MTSADAIKGIFEALGGLAIWQNCRRLLRDKQVRGVDWRVTFLMTAWGFWNLYYYPALGQWASFVGGLVIVSGNFVWVALAIRYRGC